MSFLSKTRKYSLLGFVFVVLSLPLIGCGGVSEEDEPFGATAPSSRCG
jgi:hypothetical protein